MTQKTQKQVKPAVRDVYCRYDEELDAQFLSESVWTGAWADLIESLDKVHNWGPRSSIWPLSSGLACGAIEMICTGNSPFDLARFGPGRFRAAPRRAYLMIVPGTVTRKMLPAIVRLYNQMPEPKYVISMGNCASGGEPFQEGYNVEGGIDKYLPVDVYVPGCPLTPQALLQDLIALQAKIDGQRLSEVPWYRNCASEAIPVPLLGPDIFDPRQAPVIEARLNEQEAPSHKPDKAGATNRPMAEDELTAGIAVHLRPVMGEDAFRVEGTAPVVTPESLVPLCRTLKADLHYDYMTNLTRVDCPDRFEVVDHIFNIREQGTQLYLKVHADKDDPVVPSSVGVYRSADVQEMRSKDSPCGRITKSRTTNRSISPLIAVARKDIMWRPGTETSDASMSNTQPMCS